MATWEMKVRPATGASARANPAGASNLAAPQLMQSMCLRACFALNLREETLFKKEPDVLQVELERILEQTSASTDFRSLVDVLEAGPKTRGTERKTYRFQDGTRGDVYRCVLKAIAADPPRLAFTYDRDGS